MISIYYRLTYDICRVLCDNFKDISVYRFLDSEFSKFRQIIVFGIKEKGRRLGRGRKAPNMEECYIDIKKNSMIMYEPQLVEIFLNNWNYIVGGIYR